MQYGEFTNGSQDDMVNGLGETNSMKRSLIDFVTGGGFHEPYHVPDQVDQSFGERWHEATEVLTFLTLSPGIRELCRRFYAIGFIEGQSAPPEPEVGATRQSEHE